MIKIIVISSTFLTYRKKNWQRFGVSIHVLQNEGGGGDSYPKAKRCIATTVVHQQFY